MKDLFREYGTLIVSAIVVVALVVITQFVGVTINGSVDNLTNSFAGKSLTALRGQSFDLTTGDPNEGGGAGDPVYTIVDGNGSDGLHYHNDELFTGECGSYTYEKGKIVSLLTLNFNGGKGMMNSGSQQIQVTDLVNVQTPTLAYMNTEPTKDGYTLLGWSLSQTATVPDYTDVFDIPRTLGDNITYYAVWRQTPSQALISFTIDRGAAYQVECQAEEGMTWGEWVLSEYNPTISHEESNNKKFSVANIEGANGFHVGQISMHHVNQCEWGHTYGPDALLNAEGVVVTDIHIISANDVYTSTHDEKIISRGHSR